MASSEHLRKVPTADAMAVLSWVGNGLSMEDAMRLLYPEEAKTIYDPSRWPWGAAKEN